MSLIDLFKETVTSNYRQLFPHSHIAFQKACLGNDSFFITLMLTTPNDAEGKISQNDPFYTTIMITELSNGLFEMEMSQGALKVNPVEKYLAMSSVKCGLRKTTGDIAKINKALKNYFQKRMECVVANKANIYRLDRIDVKYLPS